MVFVSRPVKAQIIIGQPALETVHVFRSGGMVELVCMFLGDGEIYLISKEVDP